MVPDMLLMGAALCSMAYVLVYGNVLDWFDSMYIRAAIAVFLLSAGVFVYMAFRHREHYYLPPEVLTFRNVWMSMLLFILAMGSIRPTRLSPPSQKSPPR